MFDLLSDGIRAWNTFGLFLMAVVFTLIGGAIVGYELYWRVKARRVSAVITGVRVKGAVNNDDRPSINTIDSDSTKEKEKMPVLGYVLLLGFSFLTIGVGVYMGYQYISLTQNGNYAKAVVVRNDASYDSDSGTTYKAVLSFTDQHGYKREVKDSISYGSSPSFNTGTQIGVYYDAQDYKRFVIDDFWHNMGISFGFMGFGAVFLSFFMVIIYFSNRETPEKPNTHKTETKESFAQENYYSVYQYKAPNGELIENTGGLGTNSILGRTPGERVALLMMPHNPEKVRRPSILLPVFGMFFLLPGLFLFREAIRTFEPSFMVVLIPLGIAALIAFRISKVIRKIPKEEFAKFKEEFKNFRKDGMKFTVTDNSEKARLLEKYEIDRRVKYHAKNSNIAGFILFFIAGGLVVGGYFATEDMKGILREGVRVEGEVIGVQSRRSSSDSNYTYHSRIQFYNDDGKKYRFEDSAGASYPLHEVGERFDVIYNPRKPNDAIVDRGIFNWGLSAGLWAGALLMFWLSLLSFRLASKYGGTRYRKRV